MELLEPVVEGIGYIVRPGRLAESPILHILRTLAKHRVAPVSPWVIAVGWARPIYPLNHMVAYKVAIVEKRSSANAGGESGRLRSKNLGSSNSQRKSQY
jgi:hypothetical protein